MHQAHAVEPALQFVLGGPPVTDLFAGVTSFPSTQEYQNLDYIPGDLYTLEEFDLSMNWNETQFNSPLAPPTAWS